MPNFRRWLHIARPRRDYECCGFLGQLRQVSCGGAGARESDRLLEGPRALAEGGLQLELALLVGEELLVVAHTHTHESLPQLVSAVQSRVQTYILSERK